MALIETWLKQDLTAPVVVRRLTGNVFSADNQANLIGVEVVKNGAAENLSGSCVAYCIRADQKTVIVAGTVSGNTAYVTLPQACYAVVGQLSVVLKVDSVTLAAVTGYVYRTSTDTIVDPGTIIPSVDSLIEQIEEAVASIPPDYSALTEEVGNLSSALNTEEEVVPFTLATTGKAISYTTGGLVSVSNASITDYIDISRYTELRYKNIGNTGTSAAFGMAFYDSEKEYITGIAARPKMESSGYVPWPTYASVPSNAKYARFTTFTDTGTKGSFELYGRAAKYKESTSALANKKVFSEPTYFEGTIGYSTGAGGSASGVFRSRYIIAGESCLVTMTAAANLLVSMFKYASPAQEDFRQLVFYKKGGSYSFWVEAGMAYRYLVISADGTSLDPLSDSDVVFKCDSDNRFLWGGAGQERFHVTINLNWPDVENTAKDTEETDTETDVMCLVKLPTTYTTTGEPVPLIMFCHGASSQITDELWYSDSSWFSLMINAFVDAGYAIFDVNNTRNAAGGFPDWGSLPLMSAYIKAWDYIKKNYNVEEKLYLLSDSMGTCANLNMLKWYGASVVTSIMTAPRPVCKARYEAMTGTDKINFESSFGITSGAWEDRLNGFNHYENIVTINNIPYVFERFPPVKVMVGIDDTGFLAETRAYYSALANSGNYVNYREVADADHAVMSFLENPALRAEAVAWFEKFRYQII